MDPSRLEVNIQHLWRELDAFRCISLKLGEEGNHQINDWLESVRTRKYDLDRLQREFSEKRKKLHPKDLSGRDKLNIKVIKHVKDVTDLKITAVEMFWRYITADKLRRYSDEEIIIFTSKFAEEIGSGGFGKVYRGQLLNGVQVAVKVLTQKIIVEEIFINEVSAMLKVFHPNIIKLYGCCFVNNLKALVFQYMENGSLDKVLVEKHPKVEWKELYVVAIKTAKALDYLHRLCQNQIIHHDVKPANILLDEHFSPKLTDFGTARTMNATHFTMTKIKGTRGYTAPEMASHGSSVNCKCDVYSFGKMLFDILGLRNDTQSQMLLPKDVWDKLEKGELEETIKESGIPESDREKAMLLSVVALWCVQFTPCIRPSMCTVVDTLQNESPVVMPPDPSLSLGRDFSMRESQDIINSPIPPSTVFSIPENTSQERQRKELIPVLPRSTPERFSHLDIKRFTSNFSTKVSFDEFGDVYKGELDDGVQVIVKVLAEMDESEDIFIAEVSTMAMTYHANLIKLYGYCFDENMIALVHEYVESTSLRKILNENRPCLDWEKFYAIAIKIANVISYLHDSHYMRIVHCDINADNVLLDSNYSPKLKSFELAKLLNKNINQLFLTRFRGTTGYTAPEMWKQASQVSSKCDVYSFGIMLFEILGMKSVNLFKTWFPRQVWDKFKNGQLDGLIEECGIRENDREKASVLSKVALWCVQLTPNIRPSMRSVVNILENEIQVTTPPNPFFPSNLESVMQSSREAVYSVFSPNIDERLLEDKLREGLANRIQRGEFSLRPLQDMTTTEIFGKESIEMILCELPTYTLRQFSIEEIAHMVHSSKWVRSNEFANLHRYAYPNNMQVLINVLKVSDVEADVFMNEMTTVENIDHPNLVKFYGYCFDENMKAFVHEGGETSLDEILYNKIEWDLLYGIVVETAKGISYLHNDSQEQIITYQVNPANVLLDENLFPKFNFFGWEKLFSEVRRNGYAAPEIWMPDQHLTCKLDVYSFGVMLFEVLGKLKNDDRYCPPRFFWEMFEKRGVEQIMKEDGVTRKNREKASILCMVGFWCIQYTPEMRPSMNTVVNILENEIQVIAPPNPFLPSMQAASTSMKPSREGINSQWLLL